MVNYYVPEAKRKLNIAFIPVTSHLASPVTDYISKFSKAGEISVTWIVKGFTCITCAVVLEIMLRQQKGVTRAKASYSQKSVAVGFDGKPASEKVLQKFIAGCGLSVA